MDTIPFLGGVVRFHGYPGCLVIGR